MFTTHTPTHSDPPKVTHPNPSNKGTGSSELMEPRAPSFTNLAIGWVVQPKRITTLLDWHSHGSNGAFTRYIWALNMLQYPMSLSRAPIIVSVTVECQEVKLMSCRLASHATHTTLNLKLMEITAPSAPSNWKNHLCPVAIWWLRWKRNWLGKVRNEFSCPLQCYRPPAWSTQSGRKSYHWRLRSGKTWS